MKCIVKSKFKDKYTGVVYKVGETLDFDDAERISDLENRKLIEVVHEEAKKPPKRRKKADS